MKSVFALPGRLASQGCPRRASRVASPPKALKAAVDGDSEELFKPRLSARQIVSYASTPCFGAGGANGKAGNAGGTHRHAAKSYPQR
jgi:hypothetical protein